MFEKTLVDVVKGIRATKRDTALYISQCIAEIKQELNSTDPHTKANALQKLTFFHMMGYSMSWAAFACVEVMSYSQKFAYKRIGYLAASQGFTQSTDVILLTTNLLKKELRITNSATSSTGVYDAGLAINCLSNIVTQDLARELLPELTALTSHPHPYIRKKAVLCLFKLFVKYPQGLRLTFARVQQCLDDPNSSVVSCAVNVITELSDKNPKNYLHLAPAFFQLLTSSTNNWMLIKVVKLLGSLVGEEPRLARKLLEPLAGIVRSTQAKSLLYEAVYTITLSLPYCRKADGTMPASVPDIVDLCTRTLKSFVEESDQNLKYLGLVGFASLMQSHPKMLASSENKAARPLILACLSDDDITIRTRALEILISMASRKNLVELISQLLAHVEQATGTYKADLVTKIVQMCSGDKYALLTDFSWYLDILIQLARTRNIEEHGTLIGHQLVDVALRVLPVRPYAVRRMMQILMETGTQQQESSTPSSFNNNNTDSNNNNAGNGRGHHVMPEILPSASWIVGEYSNLISEAMILEEDEQEVLLEYDENSKGTYHAVIQSLTAPAHTQTLGASTQSVYVQACVKVLAAASINTNVSNEELDACLDTLGMNLPFYMESMHVEVQERAFTNYTLLQSLDLLTDGKQQINSVPNLIPVADGHQSDSSDDDDEQKTTTTTIATSTEGDLLSMIMSATPSTSTAVVGSRSGTNGLSGASAGSAAKCRLVSQTLQYLLIPEPMKPVSAKAQRKKRHSPPAGSTVDLDKPVDMSVFAQLLSDEQTFRTGTISIEAVNFTQQRPMRITTTDASSTITPAIAGPLAMDNPATHDNITGNGGFQTNNVGTPRNNDPFYLNGSAADDLLPQQPSATTNNRFGSIQLLDSDEESDDAGKKKRKKKKKKKATRSASSVSMSHIGDADFAALTSPQHVSPSRAAATISPIVHSSDEDDDGDSGALIPIALPKKKGGRKNREFAGLAMVDLTTPLREDEVMPRNEHRVVPERPAHDMMQLPPTSPKKKKKKEKKKKKGQKANAVDTQLVPGVANATGDLLDFGGFGGSSGGGSSNSIAAVPVAKLSSPIAPVTSVEGGNAISSAFDDLLGLETSSAPISSSGLENSRDMAHVMPPVGTDGGYMDLSSNHGQTKKSSSSKKSKVWQKASTKALSGLVDWSLVGVHYKTHGKIGSQGLSANMTIKVVNANPTSTLENVSIQLKGGPSSLSSESVIVIGTVGPSSSIEASSKVGPFVYDSGELVHSIKGTVSASGSSFASVKWTLPASLHLAPISGLTNDQVMQDFTNGSVWSSHSVKLMTEEKADHAKVMLASFLKAAEVHGNDSNPLIGTLAAQSTMGAQVRCLVKIKGSTVKVDLKCTDDALGKALISDLKRVIL